MRVRASQETAGVAWKGSTRTCAQSSELGCCCHLSQNTNGDLVVRTKGFGVQESSGKVS